MFLRSRHFALSSVLLPLIFYTVDIGDARAHPPVAAGCQLASEQARAPMAAAEKALARGDARTANTMLDTALRALGNSYRQPNTLDDTGMHLTLANIQQGKGKLRLAAGLKRKVLKERLQLCGIGSISQ